MCKISDKNPRTRGITYYNLLLQLLIIQKGLKQNTRAEFYFISLVETDRNSAIFENSFDKS